ncbi:hypothetical protein MIB92_19655 [Aestuariirhabdus sp. Z084]|uniref:hypothetical protein n=1 Tax=Aestuariirhabdus haliotis TaxID=2918751 RepID=UPI00201B382F|nr:hypothetical protein [Aestuariirhabdus haliotis]MCL6417874.1 hypothetical protein [Aestuariirhabdus haliotis]MCL6420994.1 hypothetical protein [Aestuariirhabdus haliotis]
MDIPITSELRTICQEIEKKDLRESQWAEIESDDMFQVGCFVGGYDADEHEFCFSYFSPNKGEYWFQFSLEVAKHISQGNNPVLSGRAAE